MKRIVALILSFALLLAGCAPAQMKQDPTDSTTVPATELPANTTVWVDDIPDYNMLDDAALLCHLEDLVYRETVSALNSTEYVVENISAVYISKEYLEEVAFNSQPNIYFGYTLSELDELFQGSRYAFTVGSDGQTTVHELQEIEDTSTETMLKNVAIGTGVILVCVTVSAVSAGVGAPAISVIFAASAKTGTLMALTSGGFGAISAGIVRGIQTGDFNEAMEAAALAGSEGFKWGAISGAISGGAKEVFALKTATRSGLTMNEAAIIQQESSLPMDVISQLHSMDEYLVYKDAGLKPVMVNGRTALVQNIDLNYVSTLPDGSEITNLERMLRGMSPLDPLSGKAYELHHVGQNNDGVFAVLTQEQHRGKGVFAKLHHIWNNSNVDHGSEWNKLVSEFWKSFANCHVQGGG